MKTYLLICLMGMAACSQPPQRTPCQEAHIQERSFDLCLRGKSIRCQTLDGITEAHFAAMQSAERCEMWQRERAK